MKISLTRFPNLIIYLINSEINLIIAKNISSKASHLVENKKLYHYQIWNQNTSLIRIYVLKTKIS